MWKIGAALAVWVVGMVFLWMPGFGSVAIPHTHYEWLNYGPFGYYAREMKDGRILFEGLRLIPLTFTIAASLAVSFFTAKDVNRSLNR